jgi:hypothetical protein
MSLRINGSVLGKRNVPTLSLATGMWNMRAQALYKRDNLWPIAYDPDAAAYFGAVATAGGTVSDAQKTAIDTFFRTGKSDGWYSSLKRMYLPIWAAAAPNAICMTSLTSGTFVGGVTHGAGFVQGNGTTGYFDSGISMPSVGASNASASMWSIVPLRTTGVTAVDGQAPSGVSNERAALGITALNTSFYSLPSTVSSVSGSTALLNPGISIGSTNSTSSRFVKYKSSGAFTTSSNTTLDVFDLSTSRPFFMARNVANTFAFAYHTERRGGYGFGLGLTEAQAESFVNAIQILWEGTTGLTLA